MHSFSLAAQFRRTVQQDFLLYMFVYDVDAVCEAP